ncbi:MAG: hypothetical protein NTX03_04890 [Bacteroidetes bacterium]|nr:hypothetical protein [Bacteroidota bacterium]
MRGIEPDGYLAMTMDEVITFYVALDFSCKFFVSGAGDAYREHFITTQLGNEEDFEEVRTSYLQQATFIMKDLEANYAIVHERFKRSMEKLATYEVE